jgi:acyl-CoA synthetase (AMP-forming)/AMP-acid ligase II
VLIGPATGSLVEPATGRSWSRAEITRRVSVRAAQHRAEGLQRGDRVFLHFGNCAEFFVERLAVWQIGACVVPIDPSFTPFEIETLSSWAKLVLARFRAPDRAPFWIADWEGTTEARTQTPPSRGFAAGCDAS